MLIEDLAVIVAGVVIAVVAMFIITATVFYRRERAELPLPSTEETQLQLEAELEKVNKEIESLQEEE